MIFCSPHRSVPCSDIITEASSCRIWEQIKSHCHILQRVRNLVDSILNGMSPTNPSEFSKLLRRGDRNSIRTRGNEGHQENKAF